MTESQLNTALVAIVPRVFPDVAPEGTAMPYCTWQQIGGTPVNFMSESSYKKNARIQINVWSKTRKEAMTLIRQIEDAMVLAPLYGFVESGATATMDEDTKLRGAMQDFSFWIE